MSEPSRICRRCRRILRNPASIQAGMAKTCARKAVGTVVHQPAQQVLDA